jgi:hypothetical protein
MSASKPAIGFIGVGLMARGMAKNIVTKGYQLAGREHRKRQPVDSLLLLGATESVRELAQRCDIVYLCVTGSPKVETLMLGDDGLLAHLRLGAGIIDCSTSNMVFCRRPGLAHAEGSPGRHVGHHGRARPSDLRAHSACAALLGRKHRAQEHTLPGQHDQRAGGREPPAGVGEERLRRDGDGGAGRAFCANAGRLCRCH